TAGEIAHTAKQEARMIKSAIKVITVTVFFMALIAAPPVVPVFAAGGGGGGGGDPPASDTSTTTKSSPAPRSAHKAKKPKQSFLSDPAFIAGYRAAYATIYEGRVAEEGLL